MPIGVGSSLHPVMGPLIALLVVALLSLFLRWAFAPGPRPPSSDVGLLVRVATLSRREAALSLRAVLADAGIRSTIRTAGPGEVELLVFPEDADRARLLASSFPAG